MILAEVNNVRESVLSTIAQAVPEQQYNEVPSPPTQMINQTTNQDQVSYDMISVIKELQNEIKDLKRSRQNNHQQGQSSRKNNHQQGQYRGYTTRVNKSKYCYTHGACAHDGKFCKKKRQGHKDSATFENKIGGSTAYCQAVE